MAILTEAVKAEIRRTFAAEVGIVDKTKSTINSISQALEDEHETSCRPGLEAAIGAVDNTLSAGEKQILIQAYLDQKLGM